MLNPNEDIRPLHSPAFLAWLDDVGSIDRRAEPRGGVCASCGTAVGSIAFVGGHCAFCAAYQFGRYEKSVEFARFAKLALGLIENLSLVELAREIADIEWGAGPPFPGGPEASGGSR